ncbi:hypothetical protein TREMEDRAFT_29364 [Tremella mesenterica DSM 1558]|uniref:uncharacterized protein n=1 Tax=Tremella mesenterica (strain ATCC 24925 / CBS 8224 / DSM 1558 / NBRC 9311 / NRRL Y-6157 / RJB 2259-6 / UBC 559-6) TaxID=578456 RepID=UPI0003F4999E|nr:uncharacterized protein TREMEDRAFT_29364 [Tremella mesenterica DSM 1558]EIW69777.1 hypothetical protein TREMEDRAFT_29364 [Tremella mesenterica DSM 1558]
MSLACLTRLEGTGMDWSGLEWTGVDWSGLEWTGVDWSGLEWTGLEWIGLDSKRVAMEMTFDQELKKTTKYKIGFIKTNQPFPRGSCRPAAYERSEPSCTVLHALPCIPPITTDILQCHICVYLHPTMTPYGMRRKSLDFVGGGQ